MKFLQQLRQPQQRQESQNFTYIDECGFDNRLYQDYGYAKRGKKIYGSRTGKRTPRENLIAARRSRELLAPILIQGSVNAVGFEKWLKRWLMGSNAKKLVLAYSAIAPLRKRRKNPCC